MGNFKKAYYNEGRDVYFGELSESGKRHGKGTYLFCNGAKYDGNWSNDQMDGLGVFTWASGEQYKGVFRHGKLEGRGKKVYNSGDVYIGEWLKNSPHGHGEKTYAYGDRFVGSWECGKREGFGEYFFAEGDQRMEACWVADKVHGRAILYEGSTRTYLEYEHGLKHGHSLAKHSVKQCVHYIWERDKEVSASFCRDRVPYSSVFYKVEDWKV